MATMMLTSTLRGATGMIPHALPGLHGGRLAYITTAAAVEPWGFAHTMLTRRQLRQLGFRVTSPFTIRPPWATWPSTVVSSV